MTLYNRYISKYGYFSHILNIFINEELCENEKSTIISTIYNTINNIQIDKNILDTHIPLKWRVSDETDLLHYYTSGCVGILSDIAVQEHVKMTLIDISHIIGKNKCSFMITKPITKAICII